jgi:hypothetical protein
MKKILTAFVALSAIAGALFIARHFSYCGSEWVRTEFATLDDAKSANAFKRGWLPPTLPDGTRNIVKVNDVESNFGEGSFHFPPEATAVYIETMKTSHGATVTSDIAGTRIWVTNDTTHWTVNLDPQVGRGNYTVGLKR